MTITRREMLAATGALCIPYCKCLATESDPTRVFKEGENAARNVVRAASTYKNGGDLRAISAQIKPDIAKIQTAVDAVSGIASAPKKGGWSLGFKVGSPDPMPGDKGMPKGVEGSFVVTWIF